MLKVDVYNQLGEKTGKIELNARIFGVDINPTLMAQAVRVYLNNQRRGTASTKSRGEVSGGGKKPWRQKGTGRARQGSTRAPHWIKGGVAHGPKPKDWSLELPKKMRRAALFSALSDKVKEGKLVVLDTLDIKEIKTKVIVSILEKLPVKGKVLVILPEKNETVYLSARNIKNVKVGIAKDLNTYETMNADNLLMLKNSLAKIEQTFLKQKVQAKE